MLAELHLRQCHRLLAGQLSAGSGGDEERQAFGGGQRIERPHLPERGATVEADGAEGIGLGEALQPGAGDAGAQPEIAHAAIRLLPRRDEPLGVGLAKPFDLAKAETDGVGGADVRGIDADAAGVKDAGALPPCGGGSG